MNLIPWRRKKAATGSTPLVRHEDFPTFLNQMREEFERMFDRLTLAQPSRGAANGWRWGLEVDDEDDAVVVRAEAPGFEAGDFDLQVSDNRLILRAVKKQEALAKEGKSREYREEPCYESVTLPAGINKDKVRATYHNGVLTVTIPKTAEAKAKKITVEST